MFQVEWVIAPTVKALEELKGRLRDLTPAWPAIVVYLNLATLQNFITQGGRIGSPWRPLSAAYAKWKAVKYPGQPILRASDRLFRSVTSKTEDTVEESGPDFLTWGTSVYYGRYHQRGGRRLPKRVFLMINDQDRRAIKLIVQAHLANSARQSGFRRV